MAAASWPHSIPQDIALALSPTDLQHQTSPIGIPVPFIDHTAPTTSTTTSPEDQAWADRASEFWDDEIFDSSDV
jgi:hypothetical protein